MIMYSTEGGMDIEEVETPWINFTEVDPSVDYKVFKQEELLLT
jgi:succinyl-CoA synthetase beta subunit